MLDHHPHRFYILHEKFFDALAKWPSYGIALGFAKKLSLFSKRDIICAWPDKNLSQLESMRYAVDTGHNNAAFAHFKEPAVEAWYFCRIS